MLYGASNAPVKRWVLKQLPRLCWRYVDRVCCEREVSHARTVRPRENEEGLLEQRLKEESPLLLRRLEPKISISSLNFECIEESSPSHLLYCLLHVGFFQPRIRIISKAVKRTFDISFIKRISCWKLPQVIN